MELQQELAARGSTLPIVFLTGHGDVPTSVKAMKRGAADFLTKPVDEKDLLAAIQSAFEKGRALRKDRAGTAEVERRLATLTPREREVLEHIVSGKRNKQVAGELGTVEKTVKVHRARVMEKMQARSLAELVRLAERAGIRGTLD
jgi:FixJ family two-component response regulator